MDVPDIERAIREVFVQSRRDDPGAGAEALVGRLRERAGAMPWVAEFDLRGDEIDVVALAERPRRLHRFTLRCPPGDPWDPGPAAREVAARRDQEDALIRGLADALELGHNIKTARARLRERAGPDNLLHDAIELGARTFRELLELHTRANRGLLGALRRLVPAGPVEQIGGHVRLRLAQGTKVYRGDLALDNRRTREVRVEMPRGVYLCGEDDASGRTHWIDVRFEPSALTLLRNDRRTVKLTTDAGPLRTLAPGRYHGELVLATAEGDFASASLTLEHDGPKERG